MIFDSASFRSRRNASMAEYGLVTVVERLLRELNGSGSAAHATELGNDVARQAIRAAAHAERRIVELKQRIADLEALAATDELTGVLNRRGFEGELHRALAAARRYHEAGVLIYVDLDDFKHINDRYGHAAGDAALRHVARVLTTRVRVTDSVGRLGGDEFAILLTRTSLENGVRRAEDLSACLEETPLPWRDAHISVRASFGAVAYSPDTRATVQELLGMADREMYVVKWRHHEHSRQRAVA